MSRRISLRTALAAVLLIPLGASCAVVAGAGAAYILSEEYLTTGIHETRLDVDVEDLWAAARDGMANLSTGTPPTVSEDPRQILGEYRQRRMTVDVQAVDLNVSLLRVQAKQYIGFDEEVARDVSNYIVSRLAEVRADNEGE